MFEITFYAGNKHDKINTVTEEFAVTCLNTCKCLHFLSLHDNIFFVGDGILSFSDGIFFALLQKPMGFKMLSLCCRYGSNDGNFA